MTFMRLLGDSRRNPANRGGMSHARHDLSWGSTDEQTTDNQERELRAAAERIGHDVVTVYRDAWPCKGRSPAPVRRGDGVVPARLFAARPLRLPIRAPVSGIDLFLHQQRIDTTTPAAKAMFQMMGVLPSSSAR